MRKRGKTALCLVDVINRMDFKGSEGLVRRATAMAPRIRLLKDQAVRSGVPVIYLNDNFGNWKADFKTLVSHCVREPNPGQRVSQILQPSPDDFFILKPKHSAFYDTSLSILLWNLGVTHLVLTGVAGNICILFTASDAYMRDFHLTVPSDCIASNTPAENQFALKTMKQVFGADIRPSRMLRF